MPRIARKNLKGHYFHIMIQGIRKEYIFNEDKDKSLYLMLLYKNSIKCNVKIIAYCMMENHAHILVYSDKIENITTLMKRINTIYAMNYNKSNNRVGYVFRNRYNVQEIKDENHLKNCIAYIHKNPIKAGIVKIENEYKFSSFNEYMSEGMIISRDFIKNILGEKNEIDFITLIKLIHRQNVQSEFIDVEVSKNYYKIANQYINEGLAGGEIILKLRNNYHLSERKIAEIMKITRHKVRNILK